MHSRHHNVRRGFTLVEVMIVVTIIGLLIAIAVPNFLMARETSRSRACIANLRAIDTAKQQYMLVKNVTTFTSTTSSDPTLGGLTPSYVRALPQCPVSGIYTTGDANTSPTCSLSTSNPVDYGSNGTYPHSLP